MIFTTLVYCQDRFFAKQLTIEMIKIMSNLISIIKNMSDLFIP